MNVRRCNEQSFTYHGCHSCYSFPGLHSPLNSHLSPVSSLSGQNIHYNHLHGLQNTHYSRLHGSHHYSHLQIHCRHVLHLRVKSAYIFLNQVEKKSYSTVVQFNAILFVVLSTLNECSQDDSEQKQWKWTMMFCFNEYYASEWIIVAHKLITVTLKNIYSCYRY